MTRFSEMAYWVGMGKDVACYCTCCFKCQITKDPDQIPAPLQSIIPTKPWKLEAVDVLKVPMSVEGNQYILVIQDYFSKWPFARAMPNQKAGELFGF